MTVHAQSKSKSKSKQQNTKQKQKRLLLLPPNLPANTTLRSLTLPHPRTAAPTTYLFFASGGSDQDPTIHLLSLDIVSNLQSAFIDNAVHRSGSYLLATPFDLTFLLLHLLASRSRSTHQVGHNAYMVDDLLHSADYPDLALLANTYSSQIEHLLSLHLCTAIPVTSDQAAFRLDKSKVTKWLTAKVQSLAAALALKAATPASNVYPPRPSPHIVGDDQWAWTRYAMTLIGEWLVKGSVSEEWMRAVSEALGVPPVQVTPAGVMDQLVAASVAGLASANGDHEEAGGPSKKAKAGASASKKPVNKAAAIKVPKGQKSVAAFFAKKS